MAKDLAVVLCEGGVNSAVAATLAAQRYRLVMITADTDAAAVVSRRRAAYDMLVGHLKPYREHTLPLTYLQWVRKSNAPTPGMGIPTTDISARLVELLPLVATGLRFAAHYQAVALYLGLRVGNSETDLARATEYLQIWTELMQMPCGVGEFEIVAPLLELEPWQVIDLGVQVGTPLEKTWSCETDNAEACGVCVGCRSRDAAFEQAGKPDPLCRYPGGGGGVR